jgi:RimJ/RimL family protein N-acetyltransferase
MEIENQDSFLVQTFQNVYKYGIKTIDLQALSLPLALALKQQGILPNECLLVTSDDDWSQQWADLPLAVLGYEPHNSNNRVTTTQMVVQSFEAIDYYYLERVYQRKHNLPWLIAKTKRCLLREITVQDINRLYEIYADKEITQFMENLYEDPAAEEEYTRTYILNMYHFYGYGMWLVVEQKSGLVIGRAGFSHLELADEVELELGYVIAKTHQKQGYGYEVCQQILAYAKKELPFSKVNCLIRQGNQASIQLAQKLGFTWLEERIRDGIVLLRYQKLL